MNIQEVPLADIINALWQQKNPLMTGSQIAQYLDAVHYLTDQRITVSNSDNVTVAAPQRLYEGEPTVLGRRPAA